MSETIRDGTGSGSLAGVSSDNRLLVESISYSGGHYANHEGQAYNMLFEVTPTAANDCFLYVKNSSTTDLVIDGLWLRVASAEQIVMKLGDVGTPNGTDVVPANINAGANSVALGTFQYGANITGLSGGTNIIKGWVANTATEYFNFEQDIIVPQNSVCTLYAVTGAVALAGALVFHYHSHV
jgi:hypothetical protein